VVIKKIDPISEVRWAPRVPKDLIRRLYESDARGLRDGELLEEVGAAIAVRCQGILAVSGARKGAVRCPRCAGRGKESPIAWRTELGDRAGIKCAKCGWNTTWGEYRKTFRGKQLNEGAAGKSFRVFLEEWPAASSARDKMLAIDRVIHEFHIYLFRNSRTGAEKRKACRAACVNLIEGNLSSVVEFLESLGYGANLPVPLLKNRDNWKNAISGNQQLGKDWKLIAKVG
jgi:hypothetical protein